MKDKKKIILFWIFSISSLILSLLHEPWKDEAQSFLLSKVGLVELFNQLRIEGHPIVWYIVLKVFRMPYEYIWLLPWGITIISALIIVFKMDKPLLNKILILFSVPLVYVSASFARCYSLAILLILLLAKIYNKRYDKPILYGILILLLINTHIIFFGFACSLILIDLYNLIKCKEERKNKIEILVIFGAGTLFLFLQLFAFVTIRDDYFSKNIISFINIFNTFVDLMTGITYNNFFRSAFILCLSALLINLMKEKKLKLLLILILSIISFICIMMIYTGSYYMHSMLLVIIVFIYWQMDNKKKVNIIIGLLFILTSFSTYIRVNYDVKYYYSTAKTTTEYISNNISQNEKLYCLDTAICLSLIPYISQYEFVDIRTKERFTYVDWKKNTNKFDDVINYNLKRIESSDIKYIIISQKIILPYDDNYKVIYRSPRCNIEDYMILERMD